MAVDLCPCEWLGAKKWVLAWSHLLLVAWSKQGPQVTSDKWQVPIAQADYSNNQLCTNFFYLQLVTVKDKQTTSMISTVLEARKWKVLVKRRIASLLPTFADQQAACELPPLHFSVTL